MNLNKFRSFCKKGLIAPEDAVSVNYSFFRIVRIF